jgi:predicted house-cleaning noncanonical NTP pyrophosphatase (MazG superfamily)
MKMWVIVFMLFFLTACAQKPAPDNDTVTKIDLATEKGVAYLESAYQSGTYADNYLTFVYPGEHIACPLSTPCNVTYRLLDAYFDVYFLEQAMPHLKGMEQQRKDAHAIVEGIAKQWEKERINNVITSSSDPGGVALDTYCIIGFITKNKAMAGTAWSYLTADDDWMPNDYYISDAWRNIADESWCMRHFIAVRLDKDLEIRLIRKMINNTNEFIQDQNRTDLDKLSVIYHAIYVLNDYENAYKDLQFHQQKLSYADFISYFSSKNLAGNALMVSNILDVMVASHYDNPAALDEIAKNVLNAQEAQGYWKISQDFPANEGQVFTTFRALIGLNEYKKTLT